MRTSECWSHHCILCVQEVASLKLGQASDLIHRKHRHADCLNWEVRKLVKEMFVCMQVAKKGVVQVSDLIHRKRRHAAC